MNKKRINQMAETIETLKQLVNPLIMEFSMDEWNKIREKLDNRHATIQGGAPIIEAMGGDSSLKELQSKFQRKMFEAMHSYAKCLHEAKELQNEINEHSLNRIESQKNIDKIFG